MMVKISITIMKTNVFSRSGRIKRILRWLILLRIFNKYACFINLLLEKREKNACTNFTLGQVHQKSAYIGLCNKRLGSQKVISQLGLTRKLVKRGFLNNCMSTGCPNNNWFLLRERQLLSYRFTSFFSFFSHPSSQIFV